MALGTKGKLGISAGLGALTTIGTDALIRYYADPKDEAGKDNWYYQYSSLLGGVVSLGVAGILWRAWGTDEALVAAIAGIGTALAVPSREYVAEARIEAESETPTSGALSGAKSRSLYKAGAVAA